MNGFINIFKPSGMSSAYALTKIKRKYKGEKIGHMGTLDPMASGVLPVGIGKCTRLFDYLLDKVKVYNANFTFGYETDTLDSEGKIINEGGKIPTLSEITKVLHLVTGEIMQKPPVYSAKNVSGKRSYELARQGIEVELPPKKVVIESVVCNGKINDNTYNFTIVCKGGTYIRSICRDIAYLLKTYATMTKLCREKSGIFCIENSIKLEDIDSIDISKNIIKPEDVLTFEEIRLTNAENVELSFGRQVIVDKKDGLYKVFNSTEFIGVGIVNAGNLKIKSYVKE
jgi:tRNA pseudouridine55 synthase